MKLTPKQKGLYLLSGGLKCPACRSDQLTVQDPIAGCDTPSGNKVYQLNECMSCRLKWHDVYSLTGIETNESE